MTATEARPWVVDASVAFAWFAAVPGSVQAALLLDRATTQLLLAPDLVLVELLNAGWKSLRLGAITKRAVRLVGPPRRRTLHRSVSLPDAARHWCSLLDHPAYDCLYIALAEQQNATLITADQHLLRKLQEPHPGLPASLDLAQFS